jgi:DNA-binding MarR family transcriptional regulator
MSRIVNRLCEKGMNRKEIHPSNKRASILFLSFMSKQLILKLELMGNSLLMNH